MLPSVVVVSSDISKIYADAVVNAANQHLAAGSGVCGALFRAAGHQTLEEACRAHPTPLSEGEAVITPGFASLAQYIIHAVGPKYVATNKSACQIMLRNAYNNSLKLVQEHGLQSVAFPPLSAGIFGYPVQEALQVAIAAICTFNFDHPVTVILTSNDDEMFKMMADTLYDYHCFINASKTPKKPQLRSNSHKESATETAKSIQPRSKQSDEDHDYYTSDE